MGCLGSVRQMIRMLLCRSRRTRYRLPAWATAICIPALCRLYCGDQGYSATVYASARQSLTKSYALLERVFATQSPELVVLETDMLYDHNPQEREMPRVLARQTRAKHLGQDMRNLASVFRQTGAQVTPGDFPSIRRTHGYRYSTKVTRLAMPDYMADTGEREQIRAENRKTADRICSFAGKTAHSCCWWSCPP